MPALQTDIDLYMSWGQLGQLQGPFYSYKKRSVYWAGSDIAAKDLYGIFVSYSGGPPKTNAVNLIVTDPNPALLAGVVVRDNTTQNKIATGVEFQDDPMIRFGDSLTILVRGEIYVKKITQLPEGSSGKLYVDGTDAGFKSGALRDAPTAGGSDIDVTDYISKLVNYGPVLTDPARIFLDLTYNPNRGI
jgi:hypothetical protein